MTEVGLYKIEIFIDKETITIIQRGYRDLTNTIEQYPWHRVIDVNGVMWALPTANVRYMRITKYDEPIKSASETSKVSLDKEFY